MDISEYISTIDQALGARKDWLEKSELGKLKENLRIFQVSYASIYNIYLKKKLIDEDPYKHESKISELEVPETGSFNEAKRIEQLTIRLSNYDNQLDFLVNFYQLGVDFLNLDRIKRIVGLIRYIDWTSFSPDSQSIMTKAVADLTNQSKAGVDALTLSIIGESLSKLSKTTAASMAALKELNIYYRECYKLSVRQSVTQSMSAGEATLDNIKKKMSSAMQGKPFYKELIEEIIKEDYAGEGGDLRESILNTLKVKEDKPKTAKQAVDFKKILLDGIVVIGGASNTLGEIITKITDNNAVLESRKKGFFEAIKELIRQITNAEPEEVVFNIERMDDTKGVPVKEKLYFRQFLSDLDKKIKILTSFCRGPAYNKLSAMSEDQIISYLERNIREVQNFHKTLSAIDDFFKATASAEDRDKIKGIKPDLSALKNTYVKANQLRYEYSAQKEEEEQMRSLGIAPVNAPNQVPAPPPSP
ncbi:MAG: hypothetical protein FWC06_05740 [Treponema sp.]|nr:hypothetical protein [Treponema sp.]